MGLITPKCLRIRTSTPKKHEHNNAVPIFQYLTIKKKYKKPLTAKDSASFMIRGNDTLVYVENYPKANGVRVEYEYKDSTFLHYYKDVAFQYKVDSLKSKASMRYWKEGLRIYLSKSIFGKPKREFKRFAKEIGEVSDSLKVSFVSKVEESNYIIYAQGDFEYESSLINQKYSDFYLFWNGKNQIYKCALKVNKKQMFNNELLTYKLKELFFKSLGYFSLSDELSCDNYFSNCFSKNKKLSRLDKALLKYHYSYGICKGTTLSVFEEQQQLMKKSLKENPNAKLYFLHSD